MEDGQEKMFAPFLKPAYNATYITFYEIHLDNKTILFGFYSGKVTLKAL